MNNFAEILKTLVGGGVDFILVGGVAATVHGAARLTQDIDIESNVLPAGRRILKRLRNWKRSWKNNGSQILNVVRNWYGTIGQRTLPVCV